MKNSVWVEKLMMRWGLKDPWQVTIVLVVFSCTGFTALAVKQPILSLLSIGQPSWMVHSFYYIFLLLPIYNILLLAYGFLFGQFHFFWDFEKKFFRRIISLFKKKT